MAKIKNFLPAWLKPEWALLLVVLLVLLVPVLLTQGGRAVPEAKKALDGITGKDTTSTTGSGTTTHPGDRPVYMDTMTVFFGHAKPRVVFAGQRMRVPSDVSKVYVWANRYTDSQTGLAAHGHPVYTNEAGDTLARPQFPFLRYENVKESFPSLAKAWREGRLYVQNDMETIDPVHGRDSVMALWWIPSSSVQPN